MGREASSAATTQVLPSAESVDEAVEGTLVETAPLARPEAVVLGAVVTDERQVGESDRAARRGPLSRIAEDETPPRLEVPSGPERLIERPPGRHVVPPEGDHAPIDDGDIPGRRRGEASEIGREAAPGTCHRDGRVVERADQRRDRVPDRFDPCVQQDHHRGPGPADPGVEGASFAEP